jgi:hypothetical protein
MIRKVREGIEYLLYPELGPYGRSERDRLLKKAAETPLDFIEWMGILASLVLVVILTRYSALDFGLLDRIIVAVINIITSGFLLVITAGPFLVRRTRRGLHSQLH